jgi:hypothetical protein
MSNRPAASRWIAEIARWLGRIISLALLVLTVDFARGPIVKNPVDAEWFVYLSIPILYGASALVAWRWEGWASFLALAMPIMQVIFTFGAAQSLPDPSRFLAAYVRTWLFIFLPLTLISWLAGVLFLLSWGLRRRMKRTADSEPGGSDEVGMPMASL